MGTPLPPNEPGTLGNLCWGIGKPFGPGPTPKVVKLRLTRLLQAEFGNDAVEQNMLTTHLLEQQVDPLRFDIQDGRFLWFVEWAPSATLIAVRDLISLRFSFVSIVPQICQLDLPSDIVDPAGSIMWGGFANVTWDLEGLDG